MNETVKGKFRLNWGHKLVIFAVLFMLFISTMVYYMYNQHVELVEPDYYEKGIKYQDEIDKHSAIKGLDHAIKFDSIKKELVFETAMGGNVTGTLKFYRPSDSKMDNQIPFTLNEEGRFVYNVSSLAKGPWKFTFEWKVGTQTMAVEKELTLK